MSLRCLSQGGLTSAGLDLRVLFGEVLRAAAPSFAVAHNHPSGSNQPSAEDCRLTSRIADAAHVLGLHFVDHVIVSANGTFYSFADTGAL